MDQFNKYSNYYDDLYRDKDYRKESGFLLKVFKKYGLSGKNLLSLGCGTCTYEILLANRGYKITAMDRSNIMLKIASEKINKAKLEKKIEILERDVSNFYLAKKFDNAMAMFNIAGYQITNEAFEKMLKNTAKSLKKNGIFVFDCWYMPAVLKDKPTARIKKVRVKEGEIIRITNSNLVQDKNLIEIKFDVLRIDKNNAVDEAKEIHAMRYWSLPELEYYLNKSGFILEKICNFMDLNSAISDNKWDVFVIARKK